MWLAFRNRKPFQFDFETQMSPNTVRLRPAMPFAFPSESAFTFTGILNCSDNGGTGSVYAGLAKLFRVLSDAGSIAVLNQLGATPTAMCALAAVENSAAPQSSSACTRGTSAPGQQYGRAAVVAPGTWLLLTLYMCGFPMPISNRLAFRP